MTSLDPPEGRKLQKFITPSNINIFSNGFFWVVDIVKYYIFCEQTNPLRCTPAPLSRLQYFDPPVEEVAQLFFQIFFYVFFLQFVYFEHF